jgi:hypothetical protein
MRVDLSDLPAHNVRSFKLCSNCNADSLGMAFAVSHPAYVRRVKLQLFGNAREKPSLHFISVK